MTCTKNYAIDRRCLTIQPVFIIYRSQLFCGSFRVAGSANLGQVVIHAIGVKT